MYFCHYKLGRKGNSYRETSITKHTRRIYCCDSDTQEPENRSLTHLSIILNSVLFLKVFLHLPFLLQFKRKSTEGVSYFLFALVIVGNCLYGLSVLLKNPDWDQGEKSYVVHHLPWLIGSLGTLSLDLLVSF